MSLLIFSGSSGLENWLFFERDVIQMVPFLEVIVDGLLDKVVG